jgi:carbonic anhydrase
MSWAPFGRPDSDPPAAPGPAAPAAPAPDPGPAVLPREPARSLAIVTCMDARLDPLRDLGLARGDAMVLRNAGAAVSDDVERSLRIAQQGLGVGEVWLIGHTDCAAHGGDDAAATSELLRGADRIERVLPRLSVRALLFDLRTGAAAPVGPAG